MPNYSITCTASAVDNTVWNAYYEMENNLAPTTAIAEPGRTNFDFHFMVKKDKSYEGELYYSKYKMQVTGKNNHFYIDYRACNLCDFGDLFFEYDFQNDCFLYNGNNINGNTIYAIELLCGDTLAPSTNCFEPYTPAITSITPSAANHPIISWSINDGSFIEKFTLKRSVNGGAFVVVDNNISSEMRQKEDVDITWSGNNGNTTTVRYIVTAVNGSYNKESNHYTIYIDLELQKSIRDKFVSRKVKESSYSLLENFPNPCNPTTRIRYTIPIQSQVELKVYDAFGREISTIVNEVKEAGSYEVTFNGSSLPSGIYFLRMKSGYFTEVKKMLLVK